MLTKEQIEKNKTEFLYLIDQINIPGSDIQGLKDYLETSDFFTAPASTLYHCNFEGGLCYHSLNVFKNLSNLADMYSNILPEYSESTLLVVGLLHDISKTNFYEVYTKNTKKYYPEGGKHDNLGNFDWFAEEAYKVKEVEDREIIGEHEELSAILISRFIPLNLEEMQSVLHHHCNQNNGRTSYDLTPMLNKYPLLGLLHAADFLSCFVVEPNK